MEQFEIVSRRHGPTEVIQLRGPLVLGSPVTRLDQTIDNLVAHGVVQFILTLTEVRRLDSSGIGLLVRVLQLAKQHGGTVKLVKPSKPVTQALNMCQLLALFRVYEEEADALERPESESRGS